jgi:hypothetical protein
MQVKKLKRYTVDVVRENPDCVFIFGDNLLGIGQGGQAIIRNEPNAHGIPTKKAPSMSSKSFFSDSEYDQNVDAINNAIENIPSGYDCIVFPEDGLGTGLAELPVRAPKTFSYLVDTINKKFGDIYL